MVRAIPANISPKRALITIRIIWFALLASPVMFLAVIELGVLPMRVTSPPQPLLFWVDLVMLLTVVPVTYGIRHLIFRRAAIDGRIPPPAFSTGNIVFWAGCEGVAFSGVIFAMLNNLQWPTIVVAAIALGLQLLTFPLASQLHDPVKSVKRP